MSEQGVLFGEPVASKAQLVVFHDERKPSKGQPWLYHGFVIVERAGWQLFAQLLARCRAETGCAKPVHFVELTGRSTQSSRTRLAVAWAEAWETGLLTHARFFLLGVDSRQIDHERFGGDDSTRSDRDMRIYNRFFEMGLFTGLRWFFARTDEVQVCRVFSEERNLRTDDPFQVLPPRKINRRESNIDIISDEVEMLPGKAAPGQFAASWLDAIQLADVTLGAFATILDNPTGKNGCCEVASSLLPRVRKLNSQPINRRSRAWKRMAMRFFPSPGRTGGLVDAPDEQGRMYEKRHLLFEGRGQMELDFGDS